MAGQAVKSEPCKRAGGGHEPPSERERGAVVADVNRDLLDARGDAAREHVGRQGVDGESRPGRGVGTGCTMPPGAVVSVIQATESSP